MKYNWEKVKVGDLGKIVTGKTPKTSELDNYGGGIPFLTPSDDMRIKYSIKTRRTLTEKGADSVRSSILPENSVSVSCIGSDLGKVLITTKKTVTNQQINSIIVDIEKFDVDFVYYSMCILGKKLNHHSKTSTAVPIINKSIFSSYEIDCPLLDEQKKVASILKCIDDKIELNNAINENLERQAQAIFKSWFVDFEPFGGTKPSSWVQALLGDIAKISSGTRPPIKSTEKTEKTNIPILGAASIMGFTNQSNHNDKILVTGRVGTHGVVQRFHTPCWTSDNTLVITSKFYEYVYQILKKIDYGSMNRGSTQPLITQTDMKKISIIIPDKTTLEKFETIVGKLMDKYETNILENEKLSKLRDTLLPKLMSGEIDVSNIKI